MGKFQAYARSNYFKVKNKNKFIENVINEFKGLKLIESNDDLIGFLCVNDDGLDYYRRDEFGRELYHLNDLEIEISKHLENGQVCIIQEIGTEKLWYIHGEATAICWTGDIVRVNLDDIYKIIEEKFKVKPTYARN